MCAARSSGGRSIESLEPTAISVALSRETWRLSRPVAAAQFRRSAGARLHLELSGVAAPASLECSSIF